MRLKYLVLVTLLQHVRLIEFINAHLGITGNEQRV